MAIQITYDGGVYQIKGLLNSQNSVYLENHLNTLMVDSSGIVLSLEKVTAIDQYATRSVVALQIKAQEKHKMFYIIGRKNKNVVDQFNALHHSNLLL